MGFPVNDGPFKLLNVRKTITITSLNYILMWLGNAHNTGQLCFFFKIIHEHCTTKRLIITLSFVRLFMGSVAVLRDWIAGLQSLKNREGFCLIQHLFSNGECIQLAKSGATCIRAASMPFFHTWVVGQETSSSPFLPHWNLVGSSKFPLSRRVSTVCHQHVGDLCASPLTARVRINTSKHAATPASKITLVNVTSEFGRHWQWHFGINLTSMRGLLCSIIRIKKVSVTRPNATIVLRQKYISEYLRSFPDIGISLLDLRANNNGAYNAASMNGVCGKSILTYYTLFVRVPPSKPSLHVTETTSSSIRVQWNVGDTGGAVLTGATLHYRSAGGEWQINEMGNDRRASTVTGLPCGTRHHFYLTAHNSIGSSEASPTVEARTKGRPPEAPPQFQFITSNSSQATLYLSQWGDGGCQIKHFNIQYQKEDYSQWTKVGSEIAPRRTYAVVGLTGGTTYKLQVTAVNAAGHKTSYYTFTTPSMGHLGSGINVWGSADMSSPGQPLWRDPTVLVPAALSLLTLSLTCAAIACCLRKRPSRSPPRKIEADKSTKMTAAEEKAKLQAQDRTHTIMRRPQPEPPHEIGQSDYSEEELYPYATATFPLRGTPPPPAPSSPPSHRGGGGQKGFSALVYQAPSLHDVDSPNVTHLVQVERHKRPPPHRGFPYEASETDDYGPCIQSSSESRTSQHRRQRQSRTSRRGHSVRFP
ncbi:unnamed protein product, partial [Meganyctiphanes norvegica]